MNRKKTVSAICVVPRFALIHLVQNGNPGNVYYGTQHSSNNENFSSRDSTRSRKESRMFDDRRNAVTNAELNKEIIDLKDIVLKRVLEKYHCI